MPCDGAGHPAVPCKLELGSSTGYWLELETVTSHSGGILEGQTTYRLYLSTVNATDYFPRALETRATP